MLLSRSVIARAVIATAVLVGMAMLIIPQNAVSTESSSLRHRSLQILQEAASSQHQASYQVNAGQRSQPQTSFLKAQQNMPVRSSPGISQLSPQASLWNSQNGGDGSLRSSTTGQQGTLQQPPQQYISQAQQIPQQQVSQQKSMFRSENTSLQNGNHFQPLASAPNLNQRQQTQPLFSGQQQQQQDPIGNLQHQSLTGSVAPQQSQDAYVQQQQQLFAPQLQIGGKFAKQPESIPTATATFTKLK
jgi:hypothetical protein